jgi:hypothetical protein
MSGRTDRFVEKTLGGDVSLLRARLSSRWVALELARVRHHVYRPGYPVRPLEPPGTSGRLLPRILPHQQAPPSFVQTVWRRRQKDRADVPADSPGAFVFARSARTFAFASRTYRVP